MKMVADKIRRIRLTVTADMASDAVVENERGYRMLNKTLSLHQSADAAAAVW